VKFVFSRKGAKKPQSSQSFLALIIRLEYFGLVSVSKWTKENEKCVNSLKAANADSLRTLHEIALRTLREILLVTYSCISMREPPGGPVGVRSTERSEPRKVATRSEAKGHAQRIRKQGIGRINPSPVFIFLKRLLIQNRLNRRD
jgi:hypothetical protein